MTFEKMLLSPGVLISLALALVASVVLTFFPLIGALGFEFSAISAVVLSFLSVFISASLINSAQERAGQKRGPSYDAGSILFINFILLLIPFLIGLTSSLIQDDCNIKEGAVFFLLIPAVTVFFSASIGMLAGHLFGRKGKFIGPVIILAILCYALLKLYYGVSIFVYNPIFGLFPGPLYDETIPITPTLIISRAIIFLWGILLLLILRIGSTLRHRMSSVWDMILAIVIVVVLITAYVNESKIGISYTRDYITKNILSGSFETDNFIIYYAPGTSVAKNIDLISQDHEWRYNQLKEILDVNSGDKIRSYIYPDEEIRKKLAGAGQTTIANPIHKEIHLVYDSFPHPILKHELTHVMSSDFGSDILKLSPKIGLLEGIAVAADWGGQRFTPHQWSKAMIEIGIAPSIEEITGFGFWYAPSQVSYTLMGSFCRYLIDTYGIEDFKKAYKTGDFSVYEKTLPELARQWQDYIETIEIPEETIAITQTLFSAPSIFTATCPRQVAELKKDGYEHFEGGNYHNARDSFSSALEFNSADPFLINWLAYSHYYEGNYKRVLEISNGPSSAPELDKRFLDNIGANALWQQGNLGEAAQIFKSLLKEHITPDLRRELEVKISAMSQEYAVHENIKQFFGTRDKPLQLWHLKEAVRVNPSYGPAHYMLGRFFFNKAEYEKAAPHLLEASLLGLPAELLTNENLRILGISQFASGNVDQAIATFKYLFSLEQNEASKHYARDFIDRSEWIKKYTQTKQNQLK